MGGSIKQSVSPFKSAWWFSVYVICVLGAGRPFCFGLTPLRFVLDTVGGGWSVGRFRSWYSGLAILEKFGM